MKIEVAEILRIIKGEQNSVKVDKPITSFVIDSRKVKKGSLFFAIKGNKTDGHLFLEDAFKRGALGAVVEEKFGFSNNRFLILKTNSAKGALLNMGKYARNKLKGKVIGITGSAGKTTTKEMVALVLNNFFAVSKTPGNANTEFSIPLFFLNHANENSAFHVVEMGIQKKGDMDILNDVSKPDFGLLLNAGMSHLKYLGNVKNVAEEKFKLADFVDKNRGTVILNGDDENFRKFSKVLKKKPIFFSLKNNGEISMKIKSINLNDMMLDVHINEEKFSVCFPFSGINFAYDIAATISIAYSVGLPLRESIKAISEFTPMEGRGNEVMLSENRLLVDETYNANPISFEYSLSRFKNHKRPLFVVLGDMFELGEQSENAHRKLGKILANIKPDLVLAAGKYSEFTIEEIYNCGIKNAFYFPKRTDLTDFLSDKIEIPKNSVIFVKGSRGMKMEEAIKIIKEKFGYE